MKTITLLPLLLCLLLVGRINATDFTDTNALDGVALDAGWTSSVSLDGCDIWMGVSTGGASSFQFKIGPGGSMADLRSSANVSLLSPPFGIERTDRVVQWTMWGGVAITNASWPVTKIFNLTQAGTFGDGYTPRDPNGLAPVQAAVISTNQARVDVWAIPQDQWFPQNQPYLYTQLASLTRYEFTGPGVLTIRRVILMDDIHHYGNITNLTNVFLEAWTPFKRSPFTAYAVTASAAGVPAWWYRCGYNIPSYPAFPSYVTAGYGIAYVESGYASQVCAAICFGTNEPTAWTNGTSSTYGHAVLNSLEWNTGLGILPAIRDIDVPKDAVLDVRVALVVGSGLNANFMSRVNYVTPKLPAPRVIFPWTVVDGDLTNIIAQLKSMRAAPNTLRTTSLGPVLCRPCAVP